MRLEWEDVVLVALSQTFFFIFFSFVLFSIMFSPVENV